MSDITIKSFMEFLNSEHGFYHDTNDEDLMKDIYQIMQSHKVDITWLTCEDDYSWFFKEFRAIRNEIEKRDPNALHAEYLEEINNVSQRDIEDHQELLVELCSIIQNGYRGVHEEL